MRVLGVDPGLGRTGVAVVDGGPGGAAPWCTAAASAPRRASTTRERLFLLSELITAVVREYRPAFAAVERLFFSTNRSTAMRVSEARGVLLCALAAAARAGGRVHAERGQGGRCRLRRGPQAAGAAHDPAAALGRAHRRAPTTSPTPAPSPSAITTAPRCGLRLRAQVRDGRGGALDAAVAAARARLEAVSR